MKLRSTLVWLVVSTLLHLAAAPGAWAAGSLVDGPHLLGDSGVGYKSYETMEHELESLAARHSLRAKLIHYGKTPGGRNLNVLRIEDAAAAQLHAGEIRPAVQISGAIHGNEYLGIEQDLAETFLNSTATGSSELKGVSLYLATGGVIYVIPVINPDGYAKRQRGNSKGVDLNRDFDILPIHDGKFTQPETRALAQYLDQDVTSSRLKLKFTMDYHCCVPALITPWTYKDAQPEQADLAAFNQIGEMQTRLLGYDVGNAADTVGYLAAGSSVDYFYAKHGTLAFTIEGRYGGEAKVLGQHVKLFDEVFEKLALRQLGVE